MSDYEPNIKEEVLEVYGELDRLDNSHDPTVALFRELDAEPVLAKVGTDLHLLSSALVYARKVDIEYMSMAWDKQGKPDLVPLSTQNHRFDASDFRDVADVHS